MRHFLIIISVFFSLLFNTVFAAQYGICVVSKEAGYYSSLAKHVARWLKQESVDAKVVVKEPLKKALADSHVAFLIGYSSVSADDMSAIKTYCSNGGRLIVFHSADPALASFMGVKPIGYAAAAYPGQWSKINFSAQNIKGCPSSIYQTSTVLQRARPVQGRSSVIATWSDRNGKTTNEPAWIVSRRGYWMTHVLLGDGDENLKAQLVASLVGSILPNKWNYEKSLKRKAADAKAVTEYAKRQKKRSGEIHAVWDHSGCGLYPGNWAKTISVLKANGVTDLFVNVAGAGFAHYKSDILPRSKTYEQEGDQMAAVLAAARGSNIRVHAWLLCFTATRSTPARLEYFAKKGWRVSTRENKLSEYLDPSNQAVRSYILSAIDEIQAKYPSVNGIHLDFVRWYELGKKPSDAATVISKFVAAAKRRVVRPRWFTVAVLGKYPACVNSVGQDWVGWLGSNIVDYVVPMDYTENSQTFETYVKQHAALKNHASKTIAGIGVTANESRLSALQVINQIKTARKYNLAGVALFDLDRTLETQILPYLRLGLW